VALTEPKPLVDSQLADALASFPGTSSFRVSGSREVSRERFKSGTGCCYRHLQGTLSG
jgi:hypothetical protein